MIRRTHRTNSTDTLFTCHNGTTATGKNASHLPTTASCDQCHRTIAWTPATFNHSGVTVGGCNTCHNGTTATGKRSEEHTSELQSLMRISYAVFCLKKKK